MKINDLKEDVSKKRMISVILIFVMAIGMYAAAFPAESMPDIAEVPQEDYMKEADDVAEPEEGTKPRQVPWEDELNKARAGYEKQALKLTPIVFSDKDTMYE